MNIRKDTKILVVDDSGAIRSIIRKLLAQLGFNDVDEATDGKDALAKIHEKKYGLVISDWNMEPMNGQALLEHVRVEKHFANLPFIMMTAESAISKVVDAKHAGVDCFINKPFDVETLKVKISSIGTKIAD
jgi:two-component system chemotaxis response regulator CheY